MERQNRLSRSANSRRGRFQLGAYVGRERRRVFEKVVAQDIVLGRDQRVLGENIAKGRVAIMFGLTSYSLLPFIKAGLPLKAVSGLKEGTYGTGGSGNVAIIKTPAHP